MSKVRFNTEHYTGNVISTITRFSKDAISRDSGLMKVRAGRDAWDLKVNCEASLLADSIGVERGRAAERRANRKPKQKPQTVYINTGCPRCGSYEGDATECPECGHGQ